jgi:hypothetical protein
MRPDRLCAGQSVTPVFDERRPEYPVLSPRARAAQERISGKECAGSVREMGPCRPRERCHLVIGELLDPWGLRGAEIMSAADAPRPPAGALSLDVAGRAGLFIRPERTTRVLAWLVLISPRRSGEICASRA